MIIEYEETKPTDLYKWKQTGWCELALSFPITT